MFAIYVGKRTKEALDKVLSHEMKNLTAVELMIRTDPSVNRIAAVFVESIAWPSRLWLACKALFFCVVVALLCVLVPLVHFVLTPAWLIGGLIVFARKSRQGYFMEAASIGCPKCDSNLNIQARAFNWPRREYCYQCRNEIVIAQKSGD